MDDLQKEFRDQLSRSRPDPVAICALFDGASHDERVAAARALRRRDQKALYGAAKGFRPLSLVDLVPAAREDWSEVRHHGKNTLPAFTHFEKRFCRPPGEDRMKPATLYGYNHQTMMPLTGPGYFTALADAARGEVWIDYRCVPEQHPDAWPPVRPNERGLSRFVYGFMVDTLRRVSDHVTVGSAARNGSDLGSWFVLVRED